MYHYVNGKKTRRNQNPPNPPVKEKFVAQVRENLNENGNGVGKCPTWVFIILGVITALIATWLIFCIVKGKTL